MFTSVNAGIESERGGRRLSAEKHHTKNMEPAEKNHREGDIWSFLFCQVRFFTFAARGAEEDFREERHSKNNRIGKKEDGVG